MFATVENWSIFELSDSFRLDSMATWSWPQVSAYFLAMMTAIEILQWIIMNVFGPTKKIIPVRDYILTTASASLPHIVHFQTDQRKAP